MEKELYNSDINWNEEKYNGEYIKIFFEKVKVLFPWLILSIVLCISLGYTYATIKKKEYSSTAIVLIDDQDNKLGSNSKDLNALQNMGLFQNSSNVDNELGIFRSYSLMGHVIEDLNIQFSLECINGIRKECLYGKNAPISINSSNEALLKNEDCIIFLNENYYTLTNRNGVQKDYPYDKEIHLSFGSITIKKNGLFKSYINKKLILHVSSLSSATSAYQKKLKSEIVDKNTSIINVQISDFDPYLCADILNELIKNYQKSNIENSNKVIESTVNFITSRLDTVTTELNNIEIELEKFKQLNNIVDISSQTKVLITGNNTSLEKEAELQVQLSVINSLIKYMVDNVNQPRVIPASLAVQNITLTTTINNYNLLLMEREKIAQIYTIQSKNFKNIDAQIQEFRKDLLNNLYSIKNGIVVSLRQISNQIDYSNSKIKTIPLKEREFINYSRQQSIKQELYLFLLQKKEEAVISKSSTVSNSKVIDYAIPQFDPISPNKNKILLFSTFAGMLIPFLSNYLFGFLSVKIRKKSDIEQLTNLPIVGEISHINNKIKITSGKYNLTRDILKEQLRIIRSNIQFLVQDKPIKVLLVNSSISGEGKSFIAINLASIFALSGKKVLIVELDLRKPTISKHFSINNKIGFSNYIIENKDISEYIRQTKTNNISLLPSGAIAPNPTELLLNDKMASMFNELKELFDYIIVDTAPNIVADSKALIKYSDLVIYIIRSRYTYKESLSNLNNTYPDKSIGLVINDVKNKKSNKYNYQYS